MTTRADLLALADRVEREEPSRKLDDAIADAVDAPRGWIGSTALCRDYTTSLDAAASLCPPAWWAEVKDLDDADGAWSCVLIHSLLRKKAWGNARTEPQARTAAALRARAQEIADE